MKSKHNPYQSRPLHIPLPIISRNQESRLQSLLVIQSWIAVGRVIEREVLISETLGTTDAFGDRFTRELEVDAAEVRAILFVHLEGRVELRDDGAELPGLDATDGGARVAVHGVALPVVKSVGCKSQWEWRGC